MKKGVKKGELPCDVMVTCACGKQFIGKTYNIKKGKDKLCSVACRYKYHTRPTGIKYNIKVINKSWIKSGNTPWNKGYSKPSYDKNTGYYNIIIDGTRVRYHRYVVEHYIGRKLLDEEVVHHIDNDTTNNNIDNLQLFDSKSEHLRYHWLTTRRSNCNG